MNKKYIFLLIVFIFTISGTFFYFFDRLQKVESKLDKISVQTISTESEDSIVSENIDRVDGCGEICKQAVDDIVAKAISTISSKTKVIEKTPTTTKASGTAYIPMGTTFTTTSTDWYTINDTAIYIDLINDYGSGATVSWEASLKVAYGNGQAFARLWDDTNKIAVNGSELTTVNNSSYSLVSSKDLPFWRGRNLYKLQIKSLNSFEVSLTGGKIKIQY